MKKLNKIRIEGLVQGVWFRKSTMEIARQLGLTGFVQNQRYGSVYIEAEGTEVQLQKMIAWCLNGPDRARVNKVEVDTAEAQGYLSFEIKY